MLCPIIRELVPGEWERGLFSYETLSKYLCHILSWHRFINDLFAVWNGPRELFNKFMALINLNTYNLTFTYSCDYKTISFLFLMIQWMDGGLLGSSLYRKEMAGNSILPFDSFHPMTIKKSISYIPKAKSYMRDSLIPNTYRKPTIDKPPGL